MAENKERRIDQINSRPGYGRDGTALDTPHFIDGQWTRFQKGRPKKIGGYKEIVSNIESPVRGSHVFSKDGLHYIYAFAANKIWVAATTPFVATSTAASNVFPGLAAGDLYSYQVDAIYDATGGGSTELVIHAAHNLDDIASEVNTPLYRVRASAGGSVPVKLSDGAGGDVAVSGGVVVLQPYVFAYGNNGLIKNSNANNPDDWTIGVNKEANEVNVAGTKIVKGLPLRAGASTPAGLFWSLDSLIKVSRAGSDFRYDTISAQTTIIAPQSVVEYDGIYYWIGVDRFLVYNGTVNELPNQQNLNWFFDNVNYSQRSKIWAYKNTRYGEIWWFFPFGSATECTHAIIYNVRENCWYDTAHARSAGHSARVFRYPVLFGNELNAGNKYSAFVEEFGVNAIQNGTETAIPAHFETHDFGYPTGGAVGEQPAGNDFWTRLYRVEPDFRQVGNMQMVVRGREFARTAVYDSPPHEFGPETERIDLREQRRQIALRFESNVLDGDFHMGRVIMHTEPGDIRS